MTEYNMDNGYYFTRSKTGIPCAWECGGGRSNNGIESSYVSSNSTGSAPGSGRGNRWKYVYRPTRVTSTGFRHVRKGG